MAKNAKEDGDEIIQTVQFPGKKGELIVALEKNLGNISAACQSIGIARQNYYLWCEKDPAFKQAAEESEERLLDRAEAALYQQMFGNEKKNIEPHPVSIIFFLKTRGKKRGYIERQEVTGADGKDFVLPVPIIQISGKLHPDEKSE